MGRSRRVGVRAGLLGGILLVLSCGAAFGAPSVPVSALAFSPDNRFLVFNANREIRVRSLGADQAESGIPCDMTRIAGLEFSIDGRWLAAVGGEAGAGGRIVVFDWETRKAVLEVSEGEDVANAVAWAPSGSRIAVANGDSSVCVFELSGDRPVLKKLFQLDDHSRPVLGVAYSSDGQLLVTASADRSIKVWKAADGTLVRSLSNHTDIVHCVAFRPPVMFDGEPLPAYCATGSADKTVRVWQLGIGRMVRIVRYHEGAVFAVAWAPSGDRLYSAGREGVLRVIDGESDRILAQHQAHDEWIYSLAASPDGATLATGDWSGRVRVWTVDEKGGVRGVESAVRKAE